MALLKRSTGMAGMKGGGHVVERDLGSTVCLHLNAYHAPAHCHH